jgi:23S rRNA pseudouridine2605 synthase
MSARDREAHLRPAGRRARDHEAREAHEAQRSQRAPKAQRSQGAQIPQKAQKTRTVHVRAATAGAPARPSRAGGPSRADGTRQAEGTGQADGAVRPAGRAAGRQVQLAGERDSLTDTPGGIRLQKVLAAAGVGSRRHCEELIAEGRVDVDGQTVRRFGARVDPERQVIRVDSRRIPTRQDLVYLAFSKPPGVLAAMSDDRGRACIADFLQGRTERLFHVGRLDYDSEGLMLLTNDGELAHRLAHPRYGVRKTYLADVQGPVPRDLGRRLATGIELPDGLAIADRFRVIERAGSRALVEITLHEGRKHIVRRMLAEAGHPVSRLVRTAFGPVALGRLRPGTTRELNAREVGDLYAAVGL